MVIVTAGTWRSTAGSPLASPGFPATCGCRTPPRVALGPDPFEQHGGGLVVAALLAGEFGLRRHEVSAERPGEDGLCHLLDAEGGGHPGTRAPRRWWSRGRGRGSRGSRGGCRRRPWRSARPGSVRSVARG